MTPAPVPPDDEVALLTGWASGLEREDADRLLLALANLLGSGPPGPRTRALFERLLPALAEDAHAETRAELARRLLQARWAPAALLERLAAEADEGLGVVLARCPALEGGAAVLLLERSSGAVALALAANTGARLGREALDRLAAAARRRPALRALLAVRPDLEREQARTLAGCGSPSLGRTLAARFGLELTPPLAEVEPEAARTLVEKLRAADRLTPGSALSALRRGRLGVFQQAVAALGGLPPEMLVTAGEAEDPVPLALACAAGGVDRAVFPEILQGVRALNGARPCGDDQAAARGVLAAFARPPAEAAEALRLGHARRAARRAAG